MIKGAVHSGKYLQVTGGIPMNPYFPNGGQSAGMMRYNINTNQIEVYDGSTWKLISSEIADISLTGEAQSILDWAKNKMYDEANIAKLAKDHPAIQIALDNLEKAKLQLDATIILSKEHDITTN